MGGLDDKALFITSEVTLVAFGLQALPIRASTGP